MKKIVIASDSFKGTLSSLDICAIARTSVPRIFPDCEVTCVPIADGGEGTVTCFLEALQAEPVSVTVRDCWGEPINAVYARKDSLAVIEMASAAGLPLAGERKNPELTTTYGVGELIAHAVQSGCTEILLGLGGSATNDGGCGCAAALGIQFYNEAGALFVPTGKTLCDIARIDPSPTRELLKNVCITVMCDVDSPLYGETGAAYIFAPQKGADTAMVQRLDAGLRRFAKIIERDLGLSIAHQPGAGAAGGMGGGCIAFLGAKLRSGIECVLDTVKFDSLLTGSDLVITGEGRIDSQSLSGKVISGVAARTSRASVPLIAIVGSIGDGAEAAYDLGVTAIFGTDRQAAAFDGCAPLAYENYQRTLEDVLRLLRRMK